MIPFRRRLWLPAAILAAAAFFWLRWTARFIAEDSYFYVVTARRMALEQFQSFSGIYPNNGVHPLHMCLLALYSTLVGWVRPGWLWHVAYAVPYAVAFVAAAIWNLARVEERLRLPAGLLTLAPAVFVTAFGVLYSEAHVLLWALSLFLLTFTEADPLISRGRSFKAGIVLALVLLARLDMCFLVVAACGWLAWTHRAQPSRLLACALGLALPVVPYLVVNEHFFGGLVPVSGWLKSSFPVPRLTAALAFNPTAPLASDFNGYNICFGLIPLLVAAALAPAVLRRGGVERRLGALLLFGGWAHAAYTMLFSSWSGWYWYYVLALLTGTFFVAVALREVRWSGRAVRIAATLAAVILLGSKHGDRTLPLTRRLNALIERAGLRDKTVLVSEAPGRFGFDSHGHVLAADLLTGDRRTYDAMVASGNALQWLLDDARRAGHPVDAILFAGGDFLAWDRAGGALVYHDPKVSRSARVIGRLTVGAPAYTDPAFGLAVWKVAEIKPLSR